MDKCL